MLLKHQTGSENNNFFSKNATESARLASYTYRKCKARVGEEFLATAITIGGECIERKSLLGTSHCLFALVLFNGRLRIGDITYCSSGLRSCHSGPHKVELTSLQLVYGTDLRNSGKSGTMIPEHRSWTGNKLGAN